jgi:hypothetical protein
MVMIHTNKISIAGLKKEQSVLFCWQTEICTDLIVLKTEILGFTSLFFFPVHPLHHFKHQKYHQCYGK